MLFGVVVAISAWKRARPGLLRRKNASFALAFGVRRGELVWSGRQPRLLAPDLRVRSALAAVLLLLWRKGRLGSNLYSCSPRLHFPPLPSTSAHNVAPWPHCVNISRRITRV